MSRSYDFSSVNSSRVRKHKPHWQVDWYYRTAVTSSWVRLYVQPVSKKMSPCNPEWNLSLPDMSAFSVSEGICNSKCHVEVKTVRRLLGDLDNVHNNLDTAYLTITQYLTWRWAVNTEHSHNCLTPTHRSWALWLASLSSGNVEFGQTESCHQNSRPVNDTSWSQIQVTRL